MKQFLVIGLGQFGQSVSLKLTEEGSQVIAIDAKEEPVEAIKDYVTLAVQMDATNQSSLRALNIENVNAAIVAIGDNHEDSVLVTINLRELGVPNIIVRASTPVHGSILRKVGADRVVIPEMLTGEQVAMDLLTEKVLEQKILFSNHILAKLKTSSVFWNKTIRESQFRSSFNIILVGIERDFPEIKDDGTVFYRTSTIGLPGEDEMIKEDDRIIVIGQDADIDRLVVYISEEI